MPEIVFAGRSNVGKSSLINKLFNQKQLARVSSTPGKTATINFFRTEALRFVDLPGYGYAKIGQKEILRWAKLIESYFAQGRDIRLVLSLVDVRHPPTDDMRHKPTQADIDMINFLIDNEFPFIVVPTKCDKLSPSRLKSRLEELSAQLPCPGEIQLFPFSSVTGRGVEELRKLFDDIASET